jgi:phosphotransferase system HPr (HPr) family protein
MESGNIFNLSNARRERSEGRTLRETFVLNLEHGLHARPCALLVKTLRPFRSRVEVHLNREKANGHSIMGLMALAAVDKSRLTFVIAGPDAPQAMAAVGRLFETRFEDAYHAPMVHSLRS